jgi:hypothetical protein
MTWSTNVKNITNHNGIQLVKNYKDLPKKLRYVGMYISIQNNGYIRQSGCLYKCHKVYEVRHTCTSQAQLHQRSTSLEGFRKIVWIQHVDYNFVILLRTLLTMKLSTTITLLSIASASAFAPATFTGSKVSLGCDFVHFCSFKRERER